MKTLYFLTVVFALATVGSSKPESSGKEHDYDPTRGSKIVILPWLLSGVRYAENGLEQRMILMIGQDETAVDLAKKVEKIIGKRKKLVGSGVEVAGPYTVSFRDEKGNMHKLGSMSREDRFIIQHDQKTEIPQITELTVEMTSVGLDRATRMK